MTYINFLKKQIGKVVKLNCFGTTCQIIEINEQDEYAVCKFVKVNAKKEEKVEEVFIKLSEITQVSEGEKTVNQIMKTVEKENE